MATRAIGAKTLGCLCPTMSALYTTYGNAMTLLWFTIDLIIPARLTDNLASSIHSYVTEPGSTLLPSNAAHFTL